MYIWPKPYYMQCPYKDRFGSENEKELHVMSRAAFIENVAKKGSISKAESKRVVDLVLGEIEAGLKKSKKEGRYTIGNFGTFTITKRPARKGRNPQTGEAIRIKASKALKFRPSAALKRAAGA